MSATTITPTSSRPAFTRSMTMPALRRALSMPSVDKSLVSLKASTSKGLRRMSSYGKASKPTPGPSSFSSPSTESIPVFTTPDYTQPTAAPATLSVSPLTRPSLKRAMTPMRALRRIVKAPALPRACESVASVASAVSVEASEGSTITPSTRRRSSSVSSVETFTSTEDHITLMLRLRAFPSTAAGVLTSIICVVLIFLLPAFAAPKPKRVLALRPYERKIVLSEEREQNPPRLPRSSTTLTSRISRRVVKAYRRTLRRAARARRASTPRDALAAFFTPAPKRVRARRPAPVDPTTLASDIPRVVYSSLISLPLPKGPAPTVRPARKARKFALLPTLKEEEGLDDALTSRTSPRYVPTGRVDFAAAGLPEYKGCYAVVLDSLFPKPELSACLAQAEAFSPWEVAQLSEEIFKKVRPHLSDIEEIEEITYIKGQKSMQKWRMVRLNERLRFLRYPVGGFFRAHCDGEYVNEENGQETFYTLQFYLPSDSSGSHESFFPPQGGTTRFIGRKKAYADVEAKPGRVLVFQHASLLHTGEEVTGGVKCAVRSDILYQKVGNPVPLKK
ncbi:hypothetical protein DFH06DRAFT_1335930 [Mycena polygramma]|nr:hypothetical protein DFH06DRAFT_1335930 [Mycena polygramma]